MMGDFKNPTSEQEYVTALAEREKLREAFANYARE